MVVFGLDSSAGTFAGCCCCCPLHADMSIKALKWTDSKRRAGRSRGNFSIYTQTHTHRHTHGHMNRSTSYLFARHDENCQLCAFPPVPATPPPPSSSFPSHCCCVACLHWTWHCPLAVFPLNYRVAGERICPLRAHSGQCPIKVAWGNTNTHTHTRTQRRTVTAEGKEICCIK